MALVVKSWKVSSRPAAGEPHVMIVARESGLFSFLLSIIGVDATTSLQVSPRHVLFEQGSLSGFERRFIPLEHIASTTYGRVKPWKKTAFFIALSIMIGTAMMGGGTGLTVIGTIVLFGGVALSLLYYYLNRELSIAVIDSSGHFRYGVSGLSFKRSLIEGQEIDEKAVEHVIQIIEHLIKPTEGGAPAGVSLGSESRSRAMSGAAPQTLSELGRNLGLGGGPGMQPGAAGSQPAAATARPTACPKCNTVIEGTEAFCGNCGFKLR